MIVRYSSNNSGGQWWLTDDDWNKLQHAGWSVKWREERFLGAIATDAKYQCESIADAKQSFAAATGEDPYAEGCECCGPPHDFYEEMP